MKELLGIALLIAASASAPGVAHGAGADEKNERLIKSCLDQMDRRTAALVAQDWVEAISAADTYLMKCKEAFGADDLSQAHEVRMRAFSNLRMTEKSLQSADACISTFYENAACHVGRGRALIDLRRFADARVSLERAKRLALFGIARYERELQGNLHPLERELAASRIEGLKVSQGWASELLQLSLELEKK